MTNHTIRPKKWVCSTLKPILNFLNARHPKGISLSVLAKELGMSPQGVSAMFISDNMHLSKAEDIARRYGYELKLSYQYAKGYPITGEVELSSSSGNLYGLEEYCRRTGQTLNAVAQRSGFKRDTIAKAIATGDIMIDTLLEIAGILDLTITWNYIKVK